MAGLRTFGINPSGGAGGGMAIGGAITGAAEGSVLFAGAGGILAQDQANFFWDDTNNRLGLGINTSLGGRIHAVAASGSFAAVLAPSDAFQRFVKLNDHSGVSRLEIFINGNNVPQMIAPTGGFILADNSNQVANFETNTRSATSPSLQLNTIVATKPGLAINLAASQSADADQILSSSATLLAGRNAAGEVFQTLRTPASATAAGVQGTIVWDANYIYICTATNTWKRVAIATW